MRQEMSQCRVGGGAQFLFSPLNEGSKFKELISVVQTIDLVP